MDIPSNEVLSILIPFLVGVLYISIFFLIARNPRFRKVMVKSLEVLLPIPFETKVPEVEQNVTKKTSEMALMMIKKQISKNEELLLKLSKWNNLSLIMLTV